MRAGRCSVCDEQLAPLYQNFDNGNPAQRNCSSFAGALCRFDLIWSKPLYCFKFSLADRVLSSWYVEWEWEIRLRIAESIAVAVRWRVLNSSRFAWVRLDEHDKGKSEARVVVIWSPAESKGVSGGRDMPLSRFVDSSILSRLTELVSCRAVR